MGHKILSTSKYSMNMQLLRGLFPEYFAIWPKGLERAPSKQLLLPYLTNKSAQQSIFLLSLSQHLWNLHFMYTLSKLAQEIISYTDEAEVQIIENFRPGRQEWKLRGKKAKNSDKPNASSFLSFSFFFFFPLQKLHKAASEYLSPKLSLNRDYFNREFNFRNSSWKYITS